MKIEIEAFKKAVAEEVQAQYRADYLDIVIPEVMEKYKKLIKYIPEPICPFCNLPVVETADRVQNEDGSVTHQECWSGEQSTARFTKRDE